MRISKANLKDGDTVLDAPTTNRAPRSNGPRRAAGPSLRRDMTEDFAPGRASRAAEKEEEHYVPRRRFAGLRFRLKGGVPRTRTAAILTSAALLLALAAVSATLWEARSLLLHNPRLVIASSSDIQITGNRHLSRPQLLSVFGEDVDRNILTVPLEVRRAQLEQLPWVEHATVMRLLPNRFRVAVTERTPVAFVRQGSTIGLVDPHGVLLDMAPEPEDAAPDATDLPHYSFPVVSGITRAEPLSTRAARMKLFQKFQSALDSGGEAISKNLSEIDLSNPEDIKALIPAGKSDVLVHFGDKDFLHRYQLFEKNLAGWQATYPRLASADMRYERQVVLEMSPGTPAPAPEPKLAESARPAAPTSKPAAPTARPAINPAINPATSKPASAPKLVTTAPAPIAKTAAPVHHLQQAFDVPARSHPASEVPQ